MSEETGVTAGGEAIFSTELPADAPETFSTPREAAEYFTTLKAKKSPAESAEPVQAATAEPELAVEANAAPPEEATGETQEIDPAEKPPLELPRSWTKDRAEHWAKLDPGTQEFLLEQDRKASAEVRRVQNEAAAERTAAKAEREQAEKARQQYEANLPALMQTLQDAQQSSFGDIRTVDDVTKLANEDPFRYLQWQAHQTKLQAVNAELQRANGEKANKQQTDWTEHVQAENAKAAELIPELADKVKGPALMTRAAERLAELGFKPEELNDLANGKQKLSIYDHRLQQLIFSDLKLSDIQSAKTAIAAKPLPPVQRPGASRPAGETGSDRIQALNRKTELTVKEATELYSLQQAASSRRRAS